MAKPRVQCSCNGSCKHCIKRAQKRRYAIQHRADIRERTRSYRERERGRLVAGDKSDTLIDAESLSWLESKGYGS